MHPKISRNLIYPLQEKLLRRPTFKYLKDLEKTQWYSQQDMASLQLDKLHRLLTVAVEHCPWHAERIQLANINPVNCTLEEFQRLPCMDKSHARLYGSQMVWNNAPGGVFRYSTGGSSGKPLLFYYGRLRQASDAAGRIRARRWWGVDIGDPEVYLWGAPVELKNTDRIKSLRDKMLNQLLLSAFTMSPQLMAEYVKVINRFKPKCIYGYASSVALFARFIRDNNKALNLPDLRVICTTGEAMFDEQRSLIQETFGVPVANEYGSRDAGFIAHEAPGGQMLLLNESNLLEVLDADGNPVAPGETGEAVISGLCSDAQPFIRYRTGDMLSLSGETDKQGRGLTVVRKISGRKTDFVQHQDGSAVHALAVIYILRETVGVEQFKIIQHEINVFEILIVINPHWQNDSLGKIEQQFKARFGQQCQVAIQLRDEISPEASGKIRQVISKVA